jgi:bifunctional non-homologous end joining protein LigD
MGLTEYRRKRDFRVTGEPLGGHISPHKELSFVIQKHAASHLHYDFRLELDGVLKSWAVPKGPSLDPATKRLAMHVEDHPLEYGAFEGIIPEGEYGGGTVMLWDQGTWEAVGDAKKGYQEGSLKFVLHGEKLAGGWMLVRKGGKRAESGERRWFLFKERDQFAKPSVDITDKSPLSVTTGRSLEEIAEQAKRVWGQRGEISQNGHKLSATKRVASKLKARSAQKRASVTDKAAIVKALKAVKAKKAAFPASPTVQLATLTKDAPAGDDWIHEIKFDGYRMLCRLDHGKMRFISRNGRDWTSKFPTLAEPLSALPIETAIIDGEIVVMQPDGTTSFQALQNAFQTAGATVFQFYCFDLLYLNGYDLRSKPIEDRKSLLGQIIPSGKQGLLHFSDHVVGNGPKFFAEASSLHLEGIISKRLGRPYSSGRGLDWLKIKCSLREEFVIGGFTAPSGSRSHFGALAVGYYDDQHQLKYAGRVGTGFDDRTLSTLHAKLSKLAQKKSPFVDLSGSTGQARGVTWVKPTLVAQIEFSNWTNERQLRHPSFQGLRADKPAKEVVRDDPISAPAVESTKKAKHMANKKVSSASGSSRPRQAKKTASADGDVAGVRLSHPDKVLYPEDGITKLDLALYYEQVAKWMLPHVENRLLSLVRCPAGSGQKCFFQKHPGEGASEHFRRFEVSEKSKTEEYLALYDLPDLVSLVQMGVLEIHLWGSQADQFDKPDRLIFDLDPDPSVDWPRVVTGAKEVRLLLEQFDLTSFLKTTGGKGLHIVVPIRRRTSWAEAKTFCRAVADFLVAAAPDRYTATMSKAARKGKIFVDYLRNDRGATAVAPYSTRARQGASVSVPITWEELSNKITSSHFNIQNLPLRLSRLKKDPWAAIDKTEQGITASMLKKLKPS